MLNSSHRLKKIHPIIMKLKMEQIFNTNNKKEKMMINKIKDKNKKK